MKEAHFCLTDGIMICILIASKAKQQGLQAELNSCGTITLLHRLVLNEKVRVPSEPLPFLGLAKEVAEWLADENQSVAP